MKARQGIHIMALRTTSRRRLQFLKEKNVIIRESYHSTGTPQSHTPLQCASNHRRDLARPRLEAVGIPDWN
jgi:hypothetical protein